LHGCARLACSLLPPLCAQTHLNPYSRSSLPFKQISSARLLISLGANAIHHSDVLILSQPGARVALTVPLEPPQVFNIPVVLVSLVDKDRQWFKSVVGLPGATETDRKSSFCAWTLLPSSPECLIVSDARTDPRFRANALVTRPPHIQFYGGCPLVTSAGLRLGSFCIIDTERRYFAMEDCNLLCNFAELAVRELEAARADDRRNYGDGAVPEDTLRELAAWDKGILVVRIGARLLCPSLLAWRRLTS
jgi:GAF domain-containing protein